MNLAPVRARGLAERTSILVSRAVPRVRTSSARGLSTAPRLLVALALASFACSKQEAAKENAPPPPPPAASAVPAGACEGGGGTVGDNVSAAFFPRTFRAGLAAGTATFCVDPKEETRTYGEQAKFSMDDVCTTALDGECEVYKRFGLKRFVAVRYVDGSGAGGQGEVYLSRFADVAGAYGMFTKRVVADGDPADPSAPRALATKGGAAALGTGRGYVWRGEYLAELEYMNENESPEQLTASSAAVLGALANDLATKLPGTTEKPPAARDLPAAGLVGPNAIQFFPTEVPGFGNVGPAAIGFYADGTKRYRLLAIERADAEGARTALKTIRAKSSPAAQAVPALGEEAVAVSVKGSGGSAGAGGDGESRRANYVFARKGALLVGAGDEEVLLGAAPEKAANARLAKDDAVTKLKTWLASAGGAPAASGSAKPVGSAPAK